MGPTIRSDWWSIRLCVALTLCIVAATPSMAQKLDNLLYFDETNGAFPEYAALVQGTDGYLYGTTAFGGENFGCGSSACGTVFRMTQSGALKTLYNFCAQLACADGAIPYAGLTEGSDGYFYGTTFSGGSGLCGSYGVCGTVFRISREGALTTLHDFDGTDGEAPWGGLVQDSVGNLYGTTYYGGTYGCGTVFRITPTGEFRTLYNFCAVGDCTDGVSPQGALIEGSDGGFYGTTEQGGISQACAATGLLGCGTIFRITPDGTLTTVHKFDVTDGAMPEGGLVQGTDGEYYGTTREGGNAGCDAGEASCGTAFKISPGGKLTTIYSFCSQSDCADGYWPAAALTLGSDGNFYGTTSAGGSGSGGTVFKLTPNGVLNTLYAFAAYTGPSTPQAQLAQDTNGVVYGTATFGGSYGNCPGSGCGDIFALSAGLEQFVETQPTRGRVGSPVRILGTTLTGATSVTFNGVAATFIVQSASLIRATVPVGATTGLVTVTTPQKTLKSNVPFQVIQ